MTQYILCYHTSKGLDMFMYTKSCRISIIKGSCFWVYASRFTLVPLPLRRQHPHAVSRTQDPADHDFWNPPLSGPYLDSQVAGNYRPIYPKVDQYWSNVAHNYEPLALQVQLRTRIRGLQAPRTIGTMFACGGPDNSFSTVARAAEMSPKTI